MSNYIIQMKDVNLSFGKKQVLKHFNLKVPFKKIIGLIGPSGAGKTTTIKASLGLEKLDSGESTMLGHRMPNWKVLNQVGYMSQASALYNDLTGFDNLRFFAGLKGVKKSNLRSEIHRVAEVVNLVSALKIRVNNYSGGMKKRLSLAISLLNQPQLLVLDEPTVGIDPILRKQVWHELYQLRDQGTTILVTTHIMSEAELTDRTMFLFNKRILADDTPANLKAKFHAQTLEGVFFKIEQIEKQKAGVKA